jgi:simple sugar transport system ATP-binding protein
VVDTTGAPSTAGGEVPAAEAIGIYKQFGSTLALRGVTVAVRSGRCLGLVGRNGAGKSTLVSILSGITGPDKGQVLFQGQAAPVLGDVDGWRRRISTVFQHSMVVPTLTVAENVFLNAQPGRSGLVDWKTMRAEAKRVLAEWGFDNVDADAACATLSVEQRQLVEIARALAAGRRCLLLDEPTSALERAEIRRLFDRVRALVANGVAVLYISHHLEEVFDVCDDIAVLRDGELVMARPTAGLSKDDLVAAMVGPDTAAIASLEHSRASGPGRGEQGSSYAGKPCLVVEHLCARSPRGAVRDVSLEVRQGERVGVAGLLGAGGSDAGPSHCGQPGLGFGPDRGRRGGPGPDDAGQGAQGGGRLRARGPPGRGFRPVVGRG